VNILPTLHDKLKFVGPHFSDSDTSSNISFLIPR